MTDPREGRHLVWYVAYGSNLLRERFDCYLAGGRPFGARRSYPGCRDRSPPVADAAVTLRGGLRFSGVSSVWHGGMAFYDPRGAGPVATRAYLVTPAQLNDVVCQETRQPPGTDLGTHAPVPSEGRTLSTGSYDLLLPVGVRAGLPMLTITGRRRHPTAAPSRAYLRSIALGLRETHRWDATLVGEYLLVAQGVSPTWTRARLRSLLPAQQ